MKRYSWKNSRTYSRHQRKARYIRARNLMRKYPDAAYDGDFYCNQVYDDKHPWGWVDFRFFHSRLKRYFSATIHTVAYEAWCLNKDRATSAAYEAIPYDDAESSVFSESNIVDLALDFQKHIASGGFSVRGRQRSRLTRELEMEYAKDEYKITPMIKISDYGAGVVGVRAIVNIPHIDEFAIREFIKMFRELGEPITPGWHKEFQPVMVRPGGIDLIDTDPVKIDLSEHCE